MRTGKKILQVLRNNKDSFISGEDLAKKFNISRTAIWKGIQRLRKKGYKIIAQKKEGYRLVNIPDFLLPTEIQDGLRTEFIGKKIYYFKQTDSTNKQAKKFIIKGAVDGTVLISEKQSEGRGRLGRHWASSSGGIWLSVILRPRIKPQDAPIITMAATLSVVRAIKEVTGINAKIKWPNDVIVEILDKTKKNKKPAIRKVCGILTEMVAEVSQINYIIVGIGINVNNKLPRNIQHIACSLKESGNKVNRSLLTQRLLEKLEYYYWLMLEEGPLKIIKECKQFSAILGKTVKVSFSSEDRFIGTGAKQVFIGKVININEKGSLILKLKNNSRKEIIAGDVSLV